MNIKKVIIIASIIITIIILIVIGILLYKHFKNKNVKIENIKRFRFNYSVGYHMNGSYAYEINYDGSHYIASIKKDGVAEEDAKMVIISKKDVKRVENVLVKYKVNKWNGFDKVDKNVLDGDSFSLYVTFDDDTSIDAHGYMRYPENYGKVKGELDSIFNEFYDRK